MRRFTRKFRYGEKGFTLIELLVVVAILGVLAAVAVPNVGKFIGKGKTEAYETDLHNVETGVMAMLADSTSGNLTNYTGYPGLSAATTDLSTVKATKTVANDLQLSDYLTGLNGTSVKLTGVSYQFTVTGTVTQTHP